MQSLKSCYVSKYLIQVMPWTQMGQILNLECIQCICTCNWACLCGPDMQTITRWFMQVANGYLEHLLAFYFVLYATVIFHTIAAMCHPVFCSLQKHLTPHNGQRRQTWATTDKHKSVLQILLSMLIFHQHMYILIVGILPKCHRWEN